MSSIFKIFKVSTNSFEGQETGEKVIMLLRRHPIIILMRLFGLTIAYFLPLIVSFVFFEYVLKYNLVTLYLFIISVWTLFIWIIAFYSITMYALDVWIVTDQRIIDSTQHGFFNRKVSELHLPRIQDISVNVSGFLQTVFKYGDLHVQTAGTEERFNFLQVPDPNFVKDTIMKMTFANHHQHNV